MCRGMHLQRQFLARIKNFAEDGKTISRGCLCIAQNFSRKLAVINQCRFLPAGVFSILDNTFITRNDP